MTIFQSWFLKYGNLVYFLNVILFIITNFIFSSWVSASSVFGWVEYNYFALQLG